MQVQMHILNTLLSDLKQKLERKYNIQAKYTTVYNLHF
jgi:hypothetical protein